MTRLRLHVAIACAAAFFTLRCGKQESARPAGTSAGPSAAAKKPAEAKPAPYTYPSPVKGHFKDVNIGNFDLVDGIAYPASGGAGTIVYVVDKAIASPVLADSPCPMTDARALSNLRSAGFVEVILDKNGRSKYYVAGETFDGGSVEPEVGGHYWSSKLRKADAGRISGSVRHTQYGQFEFDLPVSAPTVGEVDQWHWMGGNSKKGIESAPKPSETAVTAVYSALREAALKKDLKAFLKAQGFGEKQIAAIRGLEGIDADLDVMADRFLNPGTTTPDDFTAIPGFAYVKSEGVNSKGKKFANYYHFSSCGDRLVLEGLGVNPQ